MRAAWMAVVVGCSGTPNRVVIDGDALAVVQQARALAASAPMRRVRLALRVDDGGWTEGALLADASGRARLELYGPLGISAVSVASDGASVGFALAGERRHLLAAEADGVLREGSEGRLGLTDLSGLAWGALPLAEARVAGALVNEGVVDARLVAGPGSELRARIDAETALVRELVFDQGGTGLVRARYHDWTTTAAGTVPERITVEAVDLVVEIRLRDWERVEGVSPDVFSPAPPPGFETEPVEDEVSRVVTRVLGHALRELERAQ